MDRFGGLEVAYASLGQTRPVVADLHAKLAEHEKQGVSWEAGKHPTVDRVLQSMAYKNEPEFLAGEEWGVRQKAHQVRTKNTLSRAAFADIPRSAEQERAEVANLFADGLNEVDIVDKPTHRTSRGQFKDNHVLVALRAMSLLNMESQAWRALVSCPLSFTITIQLVTNRPTLQRSIRGMQLGIPMMGVFNLDVVYKAYDSFRARLRDFRELFRFSKAAVINTTETPYVIRSAGRPSSELTVSYSGVHYEHLSTDE